MHPPSGEAGPAARLLVVDDDPHILSQIRRILELSGFEVDTAASARAGLILFQREIPDLVLLDIDLADANGLDLLVQMKEKHRYIPVIVLASASEAAAVASLRRGADDFMSKPIAPEELLERVRHNLEQGRHTRVQAELSEQLRGQLAMLVSVREVAREASHASDLYQLLHRALEQTLTSMQLDAGIVFVSENDELVPVAHQGLPQAIASALTRRRLSWRDPSLQPLGDTAQAIQTPGEPKRGGPLSLAPGYEFTAVVPLWAQGRRWGLMEIGGRSRRVSPGRDLETLTTVGQQIALALANARLQETAALRLRELALLNEACLILTSDLDLEQILTTIMLRTSDVIGVKTGSLLLADEESGELVFRITLGGHASGVLSRRIPVGKGIAGWVYQHGQSLLVPNVRNDTRYYAEVDRYTGFRTESIMCVPLRVRGEPFGVIELVNKISGEFTSDDLRLLESVAALMATAIEQNRLNEWTTSFILVDPLTRLPNHRFLVQALEREAARCRRYRRACSLLFVGIDRRLQLPEPRWHDLSIVLEQALRQSDLLCRHRDGPFAIILPETKAEGVKSLAERLEEEIGKAGLEEPGSASLLEHIRFGTASFPGDVVDPKDLMEQAQKSLAEAWQEHP